MNSKDYIYLDSAATASDSRFHVVDNFANPNSIHDAGREAFAVLEHSRECLMNSICAKRPSEIVFTSGATEGNNIAIFGLAKAAAKNKNLSSPKIIVSEIEHESVLSPALHLKKEGFVLEKIPVDKSGKLDFEKYLSILDDNVVLVSIQLANTEIGIINDVEKFASAAHEHDAVFHSDCVGAYGRFSIDVNKMQIDAATFSGHKIGTSKGIGFLYLRSGVKIEPLIYGSGQENGIRGGTQNVSMAKSLEMASKYFIDNLESINNRFADLKTYLYKKIEKIDGIRPTVEPIVDTKNYLPNIVHLSLKDKLSEDIILYLCKKGIIVSGGPACSAEDKKASHVLQAVKVPDDEIFGSIRLSFMENTSKENLDKFVLAIKEFLN